MNAKGRLTTAISLPPVSMNGDPIPVCVRVDILETDLNVIVQSIDHVQKSDETATVLVESKSIDPDGEGGLAPFTVFCDMTDKSGVGVTVISHDSESRTLVDGYKICR